jgi:[ribosomal protein S18]-alanine N-acetyltransferase
MAACLGKRTVPESHFMLDLSSRPTAEGSGEPPRGVKPVIVRAMRIEDIEQVTRIERRCYTLPWSTMAYATEIGNPSAHYTVAVDTRGAVVGYAGMWVKMGEAHITTLAVDPSQRGQKIGERLFIDLMQAGVDRGANRSTLEVRERNLAAHNLYLKFGFHNMAIRRHYYSDNGENAVIMWADDLRSPSYQELLDRIQRKIVVIQPNQP